MTGRAGGGAVPCPPVGRVKPFDPEEGGDNMTRIPHDDDSDGPVPDGK